MNSPVEEIKRRLSIEDVVGSYIELKSAGKTLKALCPFHSEKTPSFTVSNERQSFYCFGCNKGGDIFTFVEEFEGTDFKGALRILAERAGVDVRHYKGTQPASKSVKDAERLYALLEDAKDTYVAHFASNKEAVDYISSRGVSEDSIEAFYLGYAPNEWRFIFERLLKRGYQEKEIERAGLIKKKDSGGYYDRFRNRIMFPIQDSSGRVIGFSGRTLEKGTEVAKYINSPETELFKKRDILYGIEKAKLSIRKLNFSILVEGQMDLVLSHQAGFRNTVSTSGTALRARTETETFGISNLELVKRLSKNIVIAFDSDTAGIKAAIKNAQLALSIGMDVKIAHLPAGKDPADIIAESTKDWKKIIKESEDVVEFQLNNIKGSAKNEKDVLKTVQSDLFETIAVVPSSIEREHYLNFVSENLGIRTETLIAEYTRLTEKRRSAPDAKSVAASENKAAEEKDAEENERLILSSRLHVLGKEPEIAEEVFSRFEERFIKIFGHGSNEALEATPAQIREKYLFEAEADDKTPLELETYIEYLFRHITINKLERGAKSLLRKLKQAEEGADKSASEKLFKDYSKTLEAIEKIKQQP